MFMMEEEVFEQPTLEEDTVDFYKDKMKWEADVSARQAVFKQPTINQQLKNIFSLKIKTE